MVAILGNGLVVYVAATKQNRGALEYLNEAVVSLAITDLLSGYNDINNLTWQNLPNKTFVALFLLISDSDPPILFRFLRLTNPPPPNFFFEKVVKSFSNNITWHFCDLPTVTFVDIYVKFHVLLKNDVFLMALQKHDRFL